MSDSLARMRLVLVMVGLSRYASEGLGLESLRQRSI